jgi:hypothetical protein
MNLKKSAIYLVLSAASGLLSAEVLLYTGFESGSLSPMATSGNAPVVVEVSDARSGDEVMMSRLTNTTIDPERTEVTCNRSRWNIDVGKDYWVGMSIKLDEDFTEGTFSDQGMLMQLHYRDWDYPDKHSPQPFVLRFRPDETVRIDNEYVGIRNGSLKTRSRTLRAGLPADFGQWVDWVFRIRLSDTDGIFQVWRNGEQVLDWTGDNHNEDRPDGAYMKFGLYSSQYDDRGSQTGPRIPPGYSRTVYHDEVRMANAEGSYAMVAPGQTTDPVEIRNVSMDWERVTINFTGGQAMRGQDFVLQKSAALTGFSEDSSASPVRTGAGEFEVSVPVEGSASFYRLDQP